MPHPHNDAPDTQAPTGTLLAGSKVEIREADGDRVEFVWGDKLVIGMSREDAHQFADCLVDLLEELIIADAAR